MLQLLADHVFDGVRFLDGPHEIQIEEGTIRKVLPLAEADYQTREAHGDTTILPGLIDAHVHLSLDGSPDINALVESDTVATAALRVVHHLRRQLTAGVTTLRDLGSRWGVVLDVATTIGTPLLPLAPRLLAAGEVLTITGGHGHFMGREVDGPDAVRQAARYEIKRGATVLKVMATGGVITRQGSPGARGLTLPELRAAVDEAHNVGLKVAAHAHGTEGIKNALRAGVDTIEHCSYLDEEAIALFHEFEAWMVSTLIASVRLMPHLDDPEMPAHVRQKIRDHTAQEAASLEKAISAGIKIAAGTDAGTGYNPHGGLADELMLLQQHGMTVEQSLVTGTSGAAMALGLENEAGFLRSGYPADLVVLDGDLRRDLSILFRIRCVYRNGILARSGREAR